MLTHKRRVALRMVVRGSIKSHPLDGKPFFSGLYRGYKTKPLKQQPYRWLLRKGYIRVSTGEHVDATDLGRAEDSLL